MPMIQPNVVRPKSSIIAHLYAENKLDEFGGHGNVFRAIVVLHMGTQRFMVSSPTCNKETHNTGVSGIMVRQAKQDIV
jgi:hypothetical protein